MGAAQSKKRRKERKRKKRMQMGLTSDFDMPRSASADIIRTLSVSVTSCPLCRQRNERRTFSGSLESSRSPLDHICLRGHYDDVSSAADGYESCPSCSTSTYCLTSPSPTWPQDIERSTMSLNRNLVGRTSKLAQSKSSEFAELLDILKHQDNRGQTWPSVSAIQPVQIVREPECDQTDISTTAAETSTTNFTSSVPPAPACTENPAQTNKKVISILEDEESRLARWERQKQMAHQLRTLRKHIQQQEAACKSLVAPFPFMNTAQDADELNLSISAFEHGAASAGDELNKDTSNTGLKELPVAPRRGSRSKFSKMSNYRYLDNHPVLSKLQNEQNNRLESMEKRMREIRISAMQEAERRKFAEIFPAREDNKETERRLQEARETLEKIKAEKRKRKEQQSHLDELSSSIVGEKNFSNANEGDSRTEDDSGDIIPVHIIPTRGGKSSSRNGNNAQQEAHTSKSCDKDVKLCERDSKSHWLNEAWPNINLGNPVTWFLLPFLMFPLILRALLSLIISASGTNSSNSTASSGGTASDSSSNVVDTKQKKP